MKPTTIAILATFIAIAGAQGGRHSSTADQDVDGATTKGTATGADASASITDTPLSIATDSASTVSGSRTRSHTLATPSDSGVDADVTSTWDDENTDTWTNDGFVPGPSMIAPQPKLTPIAGPPTIYASTSMLPAATAPIANPGSARFNNGGSPTGMLSSEWLVMGLTTAVAAILL